VKFCTYEDRRLESGMLYPCAVCIVPAINILQVELTAIDVSALRYVCTSFLISSHLSFFHFHYLFHSQ
jgi:hypothetical protein